MRTRLVVMIAITMLAVEVHSSEYAKPDISDEGSCDDRSWKATNHWLLLRDGQYGAENLNKAIDVNKWKIVQRRKSKIVPMWCATFKEKASTESLNKHFASEGHHFVEIETIDTTGGHETTGFWVYE